MRISKQTFHYKVVHYVFNDSYFKYRNVSLCRYFWTFVMCLLAIAPIVYLYRHRPRSGIEIEWPEIYVSTETKRKISRTLSITLAAFALLWLLYGLIYRYNETILALIMLGVAIAVIVGIVFGASSLGAAYEDWRRDHPKKTKMKRERPYEPPRPREPNVFLEFLRAKKKKVCPILMFEDDMESLR